MSDAEIINDAYAAQLRALFQVLCVNMAGNDAGAVARFEQGVERVRIAREQALKVVGDWGKPPS